MLWLESHGPSPPAGANDRQLKYLLAIFETDQEKEAQQRELGRPRPFEKRELARVWRWLEHSAGAPELGFPPSPLWTRLKNHRLVDQGIGSTFAALADRKLIEVGWTVFNLATPLVRMTQHGRKLARQRRWMFSPCGMTRHAPTRSTGDACTPCRPRPSSRQAPRWTLCCQPDGSVVGLTADT